jgi:hypothetical protein
MQWALYLGLFSPAVLAGVTLGASEIIKDLSRNPATSRHEIRAAFSRTAAAAQSLRKRAGPSSQNYFDGGNGYYYEPVQGGNMVFSVRNGRWVDHGFQALPSSSRTRGQSHSSHQQGSSSQQGQQEEQEPGHVVNHDDGSSSMLSTDALGSLWHWLKDGKT